MQLTFNQAFKSYIYHFHTHRDYFECHEIMEDAWKAKLKYTKRDPEVALIMLATALYHLRRNNLRGALTLLHKAYHLFIMNRSFLNQYLNVDLLLETIQTLQHDLHYESIIIPVHDKHLIQYAQSDITDEIIHKHQLRDRSEVIRLRQQALNNKYPVQNTPDQT
ncbi:DUF309 domain-containing protein [Macrococcus capreoli]|uniref:DUF309 domain-containing protein n=1 Tax=Macrococcus capreoli TaxID=2982690 RepID=UPI0021D5CCBD|nr:DUF309 domain-containing protein [Macrococcus sp. TMW 2.2395]MCU7556787.1 DUF309 domain-containing protein [Macrococcus sp. TMW 2.2395]